MEESVRIRHSSGKLTDCLLHQRKITEARQVHFDKTRDLEQTTGTTAKARKLMHRFTEAEVETAMDDVEQRHK